MYRFYPLAPAGFRFGGGNILSGVGLVGDPSGRRTTFENLQKMSSENCKKCIILAYFSKFFKNHAFNFRAFGRKTQRFGNFRKFFTTFRQFLTKFSKKMSLENCKNVLFEHIFQNSLKPCVQF